MTGDIPPFEEAKKRGKMPYPVSVPSHLKNVEFRDLGVCVCVHCGHGTVTAGIPVPHRLGMEW